jgi:SOS regulatory protein LexA
MQLNLEQKKLIQMEPSGHSLIKGVAGSGKTTVAVHRIPYLMNHFCFDKDDRILLVTFNKTLLNYIKFLFDKVENAEYQIGMAELMNNDVKVDIKTIDSIVYSYFKKVESDNEIKIASTTDKFKLMLKAIQYLTEKNQLHKIINPKNSTFLIDEIEWIDACLIETIEDYQQVDRIGRATNVMGNMPQKLLKNSDIRASIFELKVIYQEMLKREHLIDFRMMNKLALIAPVKDSETYTHIIIDESQDLTRAQLEMVKKIYHPKAHSSLTFIADNSQSIYTHSWLGKGRSYTTIGCDMSGKSRTLSKNYRTTTQISEAAFSLQEKDEYLQLDSDFVKPSLVDRKGHYPIYRHFPNLNDELNFVKNSIQELSSEYRLSEMCIIAREKRIADETLQFIEKQKIPCVFLDRDNRDFDSDMVKISTMHSIKGLEFKVVFIICVNDGVIPYNSAMTEDDDKVIESDERKLLYVGMTRASELLYLSSNKKPSRFIKEIDNTYLRYRRNVCLKPLYNISVSDYIKRDQIIDIYSKEELIRQWILKELINSYGYVENMLSVEYPVQNFSQKGYADIVVSIYHQGKCIPFILVETKKYRAGIEDAEKQAISYMNALETVRYCLITDGYNLKIFDKDLDEIEDLPRFNNSMLPDTLERYLFKSFRNQPDMIYERNSEEPGLILLKRRESELSIPIEEIVDIPVYGDIIAGCPMEVNVDLKDKFTIPTSWMMLPQKTFMLEVVGDSMKDAGIDIGDFVIVNQQTAAENGQIVIALLDEEATLKKYMQMGSSVLLIPENSRYEPINVKPDQIRINGVVIGVMKKLTRN